MVISVFQEVITSWCPVSARIFSGTFKFAVDKAALISGWIKLL